MSAIISGQTISDISQYDQACVLNGSELTRKMDVGSDWTTLCISTYVQIDPWTGAADPDVFIAQHSYRMGLTTNAEPDINTSSSHWIGSTMDSETFSVSSNNYFYENSTIVGNRGYYSVTGSITTTSTSNITRIIAGGGNKNPSVYMVQINKTGPTSFQVSALLQEYLAPALSVSYTQWIDALNCGSLATAETLLETAQTANYAVQNYTTFTGVDEATNGYFDSVSLIWKPTTHNLLAHAIGVAKWA